MGAPSDPRPSMPYVLVFGKGIEGVRHATRRLAGPQGWYGVVVRHRINQRRPIKTFDYCINKFIYSCNHILIFMYGSLRGRSLQAYWLWHGLARNVLFFPWLGTVYTCNIELPTILQTKILCTLVYSYIHRYLYCIQNMLILEISKNRVSFVNKKEYVYIFKVRHVQMIIKNY